MTLEIEELASRAGESTDTLREWHAAGLLGDDELFRAEHVERVRLVRFLVGRGYDVETIARADRTRAETTNEGLLDRFLRDMFPEGTWPTLTLEEAAERAGLEPDLAERLLHASGLLEEGAPASDDDVEALRVLSTVLDAGLPESAVVQIARVYADSLRRVAEAEVRLFHFYVHEQLRVSGLSGQELMDLSNAVSEQLGGLSEPSVRYFHRRGWISAMRDDLVLHVAEDAGLSVPEDVPGRLEAAIVFADLSRFTPLTEAMGDHAAAEVVERFSTIVRAAAAQCHGRVVKQIGDEFMLVFFEPSSAVTCALDIEERAAHEPMFPAVRIGAHWGTVLYREGDYVGSTINVAARVTAEADAHQLLVTLPLRHQAGECPGVDFVPVGARRLKGLPEPMELHAVRRVVESAIAERQTDPVCGMEMGPVEIGVRLDVGGLERVFCSERCLKQFVAAPERYAV